VFVRFISFYFSTGFLISVVSFVFVLILYIFVFRRSYDEELDKTLQKDISTMEMLYQMTPDGEGKLGIVIDNWCLNTPSAQAVRNRKKLLSGKIQSICDQKKIPGKVRSIL
jgi:hypothetical protein